MFCGLSRVYAFVNLKTASSQKKLCALCVKNIQFIKTENQDNGKQGTKYSRYTTCGFKRRS